MNQPAENTNREISDKTAILIMLMRKEVETGKQVMARATSPRQGYKMHEMARKDKTLEYRVLEGDKVFFILSEEGREKICDFFKMEVYEVETHDKGRIPNNDGSSYKVQKEQPS